MCQGRGGVCDSRARAGMPLASGSTAPQQLTALPWLPRTLPSCCPPLQIPIGTEDALKGLVCLIDRKAYAFEGPSGEKVVGE